MNTDWQIYTEIAPPDFSVASLGELNLPSSMLTRIQHTVTYRLARAGQPPDKVRVFVSSAKRRPSAPPAWGFFVIECKLPPANVLVLEVYLY